MKKAIKIVLAILAIVVVIILALPLWIGPVATGVANSVVPGITGTDFKLGRFALNQYSGVLQVGDLDLSNPTNYDEKTAVKLDSLKVDVGVMSLAGKVIHVEDVTLDGLYVYVSDLLGGNFQAIAKHAQGDAKAEEEKKPEAEEKSEGKKVCIDHLVLKNIKIKIGPMPAIPVPTITLNDIGKPEDEKDEGGVTMDELWQTVSGKAMEAVGSVGEGLKALGNLTGDGAKALGNLTGDGVNAIGSGAKSATEAAGKAADAVKGLFK